MKQHTLTCLGEGQWAKVTDIKLEGGMRRRLQDLGLVQGTAVQCLQKSPWGDPVAFLIRGAAIALRTEDAQGVEIMLMS